MRDEIKEVKSDAFSSAKNRMARRKQIRNYAKNNVQKFLHRRCLQELHVTVDIYVYFFFISGVVYREKMEQYEREGGDITASDMILPEDDSDILEFYKNSTVLVTGATGFLGKLCVEKLLRTCPNLNSIYILIRPKQDKDVHKRFDELFDEPVSSEFANQYRVSTSAKSSVYLFQSFEPLKRKFPNFKQKIKLVVGDVSLPDLGLNEEDREKLVSEVDCVVHFAATVRFNESIRTATYINVRGVRDILKLCKQMKKLRVRTCISVEYFSKKKINRDFKWVKRNLCIKKLL